MELNLKKIDLPPQKNEDLKEKDCNFIKNNFEKHIELYRSVAEKKGIKAVNGGLFVMVDGIEYKYDSNGDAYKTEVNSDGCNLNTGRVDQVGSYWENNGKIAFVDELGQVWIGANNDSNITALNEANYQRSSIWVPFSNGEEPVDKEVYKKIRDVLTGKGGDQLKIERNTRVKKIINQREILFGEANAFVDENELYEQVAYNDGEYYINEKKIINEKLQPQIEKDNAGFGRKVYIINNQTFSFKGREEIPVYETLANSRSVFLGEDPKFINPKDFEKYKESLENNNKNKELPQHFIVNKSLLGVLELAVQLGSNDGSLLKIITDLKKGIYSERALLLLDALIAGDCINIILYGEETDKDTEALVLLSLLGDADSQIVVRENMELFQNEIAKFKERYKKENNKEYEKIKLEWGSEYEALDIKDLCAVHSTRYKPERAEDGFTVRTLFDATNGEYLRNTIHVSLNHKVKGHMYGSWDDANYVLVSPLERMVELNGLPQRLNTVDTFWNANPGAPVVFPDAVLISPGNREMHELFQRDGNILNFKSENFSKEDLVVLKSAFEKEGRLNDFLMIIEQKLKKVFESYDLDKKLKEQWDLDVVQEKINQFLYKNNDFNKSHNLNVFDLLPSTGNSDSSEAYIDASVKYLIEQSGALVGIKVDSHDSNQAIIDLVRYLSGVISLVVARVVNELAVSIVLKTKGFDEKKGGESSWSDYNSKYQIMELGAELGVIGGPHEGGEDDIVVSTHQYYIRKAKEDKNGDEGDFDWSQYSFSYEKLLFNDLLKRLDAKTLRVIYAAGALNARY